MRRLIPLLFALLSCLGAAQVLTPAQAERLYGRLGARVARGIPAQATVDLTSAVAVSSSAKSDWGVATYTVGAASSVLDPRINAVTPYRWIGTSQVGGRGLTSGNQYEPLVLEAQTDAPTLELRLRVAALGQSGGWRLLVDGQVASVSGATVLTDSSNNGADVYYTVSFGSRVRRSLRIEMMNSGFRDLRVTARDSVWATPPSQRLRVLFVGPSFDRGSGTTAGTYMEGRAWEVARLLGGEPTVLALGGTGFGANSGFSGAKYRERLRDDAVLAGRKFDLIVVGGAYNDRTTSQSIRDAAKVEMGLCLDLAVQSYPGVPVVAVGAESSALYPYTDANLILTNNDLKAVCLLKKVPFVDPLSGKAFDGAGAVRLDGGGPWITGTGYSGSMNASGNSDVLISSDQVHRTNVGYQMEARRLAESILASLSLPVYSSWVPPTSTQALVANYAFTA